MELRTNKALRDAPVPFANACAQCGEAMLMPTWSEQLSECGFKNLWECEACGYKFETLVCFPET